MKTQAKLLSDLDQDLIKTVAGQVMGWIVLETPVGHVEIPGTYFSFNHKNEPIKGATYPHNFVLIEHGASAYGIQWELWNPLTDPAAREEVIEKLIQSGCQVTLMINPKGAYCLIQEGTATISENAQAPTAGQALCYAAVRFCKTINEYTADEFGEGYTDLEDQAGDDYQEPDDYTDPEPIRFDGSVL